MLSSIVQQIFLRGIIIVTVSNKKKEEISQFQRDMAARISQERKILHARFGGYRQEDVAARLSVPRGTYAGWEAAYNAIPVEEIPRIAHDLNKSVAWIFGLELADVEMGSVLAAAWQDVPSFLKPAVLEAVRSFGRPVIVVQVKEGETEFITGGHTWRLIDLEDK